MQIQLKPQNLHMDEQKLCFFVSIFVVIGLEKLSSWR